MNDFGIGNTGVPAELRSLASRLQSVDRPRSSSPDFLTDPERAAIESTGASRYDILDSGTDRIVFALGDQVVKVARPPEGPYDGVRANRLAVQQYQGATPEQRNILAPLHDYAPDMTWLTQERAVRVRGYEHELKKGFREKLERAGIDFDDDLRWNVGYIRSLGHDAIIDYGNKIF